MEHTEGEQTAVSISVYCDWPPRYYRGGNVNFQPLADNSTSTIAEQPNENYLMRHSMRFLQMGAAHSQGFDSLVLEMEYRTIEPVFKEGYVSLELNRPDIHNAFNDEMIAEITDFFGRIEVEDVLAVVISGRGNSFCAGADLNWMKRMSSYSKEENVEDARKMADMFLAIENCPVPTIASVNGAAFGGGVGLVAVCDFAFAVPNAKFSFSEVKLGLIPAVISKWVIERIGEKKAKQLFMTGERFDASMAYDIGLIDGSVHDPEGTIGELVGQLRSSGPNALAESKRLVCQYRKKGFVDYSVNAIAELRASGEGKEGISAFLEKRKPAWKRDADEGGKT